MNKIQRLKTRLKMLWYIFTKKQVIVITESHEHGTRECKYNGVWDTRSLADLDEMVKWFWC